MTSSRTVRFACRAYGDSAVLVDVLAEEYEDRWSATQQLGQSLLEAELPGLTDLVASFQNVVVVFDPLLTDHDAIRAAVTRLGTDPAAALARWTFEVPVLYGGAAGPDLDEVAAELDHTPQELARWHAAEPWVVRFRGSPVGSPMMDGPRLPQPVRRMSAPRARVEAGAVAVSGFQSMIYPAASPGGWRVIGCTPVTLFELDRTPQVQYRPGDLIRFVPITESEWDDWVGLPARSTNDIAGTEPRGET